MLNRFLMVGVVAGLLVGVWSVVPVRGDNGDPGAAAVTSGSTGTGYSQAPLKIGVVDTRRIYNETPHIRKIVARLEEDATLKDKALEKEEEEYLEAQRDYLEKKDLMTEEQGEERLAQLMEMRKKMREEMQKALADLEESKGSEQEKINKEIKDVVEQVALRNGYTLILKESALAYAAPGYDITDLVLEAFAKKEEAP